MHLSFTPRSILHLSITCRSIISQDEEDLSNLQLAWEMLELAKVIYNKQVDDTKDDSSAKANYVKKLCETFLTLGKVSIENKNYSQAVDDFSACQEVIHGVVHLLVHPGK